MLAREKPERVLFMTGEAGIGKSTLLKQLVAELESEAKPPVVASAECSTPVAGSGVGFVEALKPFADIMSGLVEAGAAAAESAAGQKKRPGFKLDIGKFFVDTAPSWIGLIPVIGGPIFHALNIVGSGYDQVYLHNKLRAESNSAATNQEQVFRQYINFLSKLSAEIPVLIILDDFHWADTSSTNLLFAAARDLPENQVVFLVVYRKGDLLRAANQDEHALLKVRDEIERYSMSIAIEIPTADQHDLSNLVREKYPDYTSNDELEKWLLRITNGNFLFATQFLSTLEHDHFLEPKSALLLKDLASVPVPASASAVVSAHIRRLNDDDKEQLRYASVEGETITAAMVSRFVDIPKLKMMQRLRMIAEQHHVIRSLGTHTLYAKETTAYQFVHYLVHKTLYDDLGQEEREVLHGIAVDVLEEELEAAEEAQHNVHVVASRLAAHAVIGQRYKPAAEGFLKGAQWVWKSYAAEEALYLLDQCQDAVHKPKKPTADLLSLGLEALLLKATICLHGARYAEAEAHSVEALGLTNTGVGTPAQRSNACVSLAWVKWTRGRYDEAESDATAAIDIARTANDSKSLLRALIILGHTCFNRSRLDEAMDYYQQSLDESIAVGDEHGRAWALSNVGNVHHRRGNFAVSLKNHQDALAIYRALGDSVGVQGALVNIANDLLITQKLDLANESYQEALNLARSSGALRLEVIILNNMVSISAHQKRFDEALEFAQNALVIGKRIDDPAMIADSLCRIGEVYRDTGRLDEALDYYALSLEVATKLNDRYNVAVARYNMAYAYLLQNRPPDAAPLLESTIQVFAELKMPHFVTEAALATAICTLKNEAAGNGGYVSVSANDIHTNTRVIAEAHGADLAIYDAIWEGWLPELPKLGITLAP